MDGEKATSSRKALSAMAPWTVVIHPPRLAVLRPLLGKTHLAFRCWGHRTGHPPKHLHQRNMDPNMEALGEHTFRNVRPHRIINRGEEPPLRGVQIGDVADYPSRHNLSYHE